MNASLEIRAALREELPLVAELAAKLVHLHHAFDAQRFFVPENVAKGYAWWFEQEIDRPEVVLIVAVREGRLVGYAYARLEERDWNQLLDACGALHDLWVEPEERGGGVARKLVASCIDRLRERGAPRVVLHAAAANGEAQALFERLGFRRTMVEMTCELGVTPST